MIPPLAATELVPAARAVATTAHAGVKDKSGHDYIDHPRRVAARVANHGPEYEAAAWLHDVIEDCVNIDAAVLLKAGFPEAVVTAVDFLTKRPGEKHPDAVRRACENPIAKVVKAADVADNGNPERLAEVAAQEPKLRAKYAKAREILDELEAPRFEKVPD